jgi:hypothetical protein
MDTRPAGPLSVIGGVVGGRPISPGDVFVTRSESFVGEVIRHVERRRPEVGEPIVVEGEVRPWSYWNHAGIIEAAEGEDWVTIEAQGAGVVRGKLSDHAERAVFPLALDPRDAERGLGFARWCLAGHGVGAVDAKGREIPAVGYGWWTDASIAIDLYTPLGLHFRLGRTMICSELASRHLEHAIGWIAPRIDTGHVMPSDLGHGAMALVRP